MGVSGGFNIFAEYNCNVLRILAAGICASCLRDDRVLRYIGHIFTIECDRARPAGVGADGGGRSWLSPRWPVPTMRGGRFRMRLCTDSEATPAQCNGPNPDGEKPLSVCKKGLHVSDDAVQVEALTCEGNLARLFLIDRDRLMTPHSHRITVK